MRSGWLLVLVACSSNHGSVTSDASGDVGLSIDATRDGTAASGDASSDASTSCPAGRADCNADPADGCEAQLPCTGTLLLGNRDRAHDLASDGQHLFWADNGGAQPLDGLQTMTVTGAGVLHIATGLDVVGPALDATDVYWADATGIHHRGKTGGQVVTAVVLAAKPAFIAVDDTSVYWVANNNDQIWRSDKTTSGPVQLTTTSTILAPPVVGPSYVYWAQPTGSAMAIMRVTKASPGAPELVTTLANERFVMLAIVGTQLVYTARDLGQVGAIPLAGGAPTPIATGEDHPALIAGDGTWWYWATNPTTSGHAFALRRVKDGATAVETYAILAANEYFTSVAVDPVRVYWGAGLMTGIFAAGK